MTSNKNISLNFLIGLLFALFYSAKAQSPIFNNSGMDVFVSSDIMVYIDGTFMSSNDGQIDNQSDAVSVTGDWINNNATDDVFSSGAGNISLVGTDTFQTIYGGSTSDFNNLTINNSYSQTPQIVATGDFTVSSNLNLYNGIINLSGSTVTIGESGAASTLTRGVSSATNYFYGGTIKRYWLASTVITSTSGNYYGLFPLGAEGEDSYRPVEINSTVSPTSNGFYTAMHTDGYGVTDLSPEYNDAGTDIERIHNSSFTTSISSSIGGTYDIGVTMTGLSSGNLGDIRLVVPTGPTTVTAVGSHVAATGSALNPTARRSGLTASETSNGFAIASTDRTPTPLPIELLSFNAIPKGNQINLFWETATEINNHYFTIERSLDGINFEYLTKVYSIAPNGNSSFSLNYSTVDNNPCSGVSYYRLKQTDFDGKYSYSKIISVEYKVDLLNDFSIFPNPSHGEFVNFLIDIEKNQEFLVEVFDLNGKYSFSKKVLAQNDGENNFTLNFIKTLKPGTYFISVSTKYGVYAKRLIVD